MARVDSSAVVEYVREDEGTWTQRGEQKRQPYPEESKPIPIASNTHHLEEEVESYHIYP